MSFFITFARMNNTKWSEIVILVDAEYVDKVAFDLIVNFERMLGRRIPQADMAQWLECIALDGGLRPTANSQKPTATCQVVLIHVTKDDLYVDSLQIIANAAEVKRLMVVADSDRIYNKVREALRQADPDKHITVFAMQPMPNGNFRQEILGYSLMAALGIKSEEINCK